MLYIPALVPKRLLSVEVEVGITTLLLGPLTPSSIRFCCSRAAIPSDITPMVYAPNAIAVAVRIMRRVVRKKRLKRPGRVSEELGDEDWYELGSVGGGMEVEDAGELDEAIGLRVPENTSCLLTRS